MECIERLVSGGGVLLEQSRFSQLRASRLRQSILKWAFEGKLVDQDPADEPASALLARIRVEREDSIRTGNVRAPRRKKKAAKKKASK